MNMRNQLVVNYLTASPVACALVCGGLLMPGSPALAQLEPAQVAIEEIIVTARKRQESLQDTPISITAFTQETMEQANMVDLRDIGKYTPGMSFTSYGMGSSEAGAIFIRGIGQSDHMITTDPGVGLYVDGVYMGRNQGAALDLLELERVEVLRGPQGTLFGKNTIGGAVNVVSRKPVFENRGNVGVTVGDGGRLNVELAGELAPSDNLAVKGSILRKNRDGVGRQIFTGGETGDEDSVSGRVQLYSRGDSTTFSLVIDALSADQKAVPHSLYNSGIGTVDCYQQSEPGEYIPCPNGIQGDRYDNYSLDDLSTKQDTFGISATWEGDLADNLSMKSITAYRDMEYVGNLEFDGSPTTLVYYHEAGEAKQFSQELQILGTQDTFNWLAGLYYFTEEGHNLQDDDVFFNLDQRRSEVKTNSYAAFAQGTKEWGPASVTAGIRYTKEDKDYDVYYRRLRASDSAEQARLDSGELIYIITPTVLDDSWSAVSGTLGIDYSVREDILLYAIYSRGFRSGGFNARPGGLASVNTYDPEYVNVYELGMKTEFFSNHLRLNLALYISDYKDYQAQVNELDNVFSTRTLNAAEAEITGLEMELTALLSERFRVEVTYARTDAEINSVDIPAALNANFSKGNRLPYVSKNTWSLSPQLNVPLSSGASLEARVDYSWRSSFYGQISNHPEEEVGSYGLINAQIQYRAPTDRWRVALYGINLADKEYARVRNYFPNFIGFALWNTDRREYGLKARLNF